MAMLVNLGDREFDKFIEDPIKKTGIYTISSSYSRHQLREGNIYFIAYNDIKDTDEATNIYLKTGDGSKFYNFSIAYSLQLAGFAEFFENPAVSDSGSEICPCNMNRNYPNASVLKIYSGASVSFNGFLLEKIILGGGKKEESGAALDSAEWILKADTAYLIRIVSLNDDNNFSVSLKFMERTIA